MYDKIMKSFIGKNYASFGDGSLKQVTDIFVDMIDLSRPLKEKLPNDKQIKLQECYFIKELTKVIVIAKIIDRIEGETFINSPYMSVRGKLKYANFSAKIILTDKDDHGYFDKLTEEYAGKEVIRFYHCDTSKEVNESDIWVRCLPYTYCSHVKKEIKSPQTKPYDLSKKMVAAGAGALLFGLFAANMLMKSETNMSDVLDNMLKPGI